jgi:AcrR family transcriptional regulator
VSQEDAGLSGREAERRLAAEPRYRVLEAAMTGIAEHGLHRLRLADIAELANMSTGHVLYYFKTKEKILAEALRWSEGQLGQRLRDELATIDDAPSQLMRFIELYVPVGPDDPRWTLWVEVYECSLGNSEIAALASELALVWQDCLADIIALGIRRDEFARVDSDEFADRYCALLGAFSLRIVSERPGAFRESTIRRTATLAANELGFRPSQVLDE